MSGAGAAPPTAGQAAGGSSAPRQSLDDLLDRRRVNVHPVGAPSAYHSQTYTDPHSVMRRKSSSSGSRSSTATTSQPASSTFMTHPDSNSRRGSASTNPTTAPPSPSIPTQPQRHWVPTARVPRHIADRHRGGGGGNRWLSDDEGTDVLGSGSGSGSGSASGSGSGSRTIGRRRRGSGGAVAVGGGVGSEGFGESTSGSGRHHHSPGPTEPLDRRSSSGGIHTDTADRKSHTDYTQHHQFRPDLPPSLPKLNTHLSPRQTNIHTSSSRPLLHHRPRSSPPKTNNPRSSLSVSSRDGSRSPPSHHHQDPPRISDLVPPPNHQSGMRVLRTQMALIDPPGPDRSTRRGGEPEAQGEADRMEGVESIDGQEIPSEGREEMVNRSDREHTAGESAGTREGGSPEGSGDSRSTGDSGGRTPDAGTARESERKRVWRAGLLGQLKKLLTCTLCPPGIDQLLHHPLTLPCGHTLSSEHLSLPAPAPLPPNYSTLPPHDQHLLQQQQQHQRLSLWAGIMCPIPTCKRYSSYAIPSGLGHEPSSPVTAFMAPPSASLAPVPVAPTPISLASGVTYYPPPPPLLPPAPSTVHHPPPAYSPDPPVNETGSPLLDTAVDKVMFLVMRELGLGQFSSRVSAAVKGLGHVHNEAEHVAAAVRDRSLQLLVGDEVKAGVEGMEEIGGRHAHFDTGDDSVDHHAESSFAAGTLKSGLSMDLSSATIDDLPLPISSTPPRPTSSNTHRPKPTPTQSDNPAASDNSAVTETGSSGSLGRKISKRRKNTQGEPGRPELSFERELMGILECDVCALLLYEPVTTPCQHSFCGKCLSRSLDHSHRCPVCRQDLPSYAYFTDHVVNRVLLTIIKTAFPTEYQERQESIEKDERDARLDTPIFICTLAFPSMPTILHVFEPRYRLMIRRCIESASPRFGMLMPSRGSDGLGDYGTMLEIQSVQMLPDGRSMVETVGTQRFRLLEKGGLDGYTVGRIEKIDDISPEEESALEAEAVRDAAALTASQPLQPPATPSDPSYAGTMNPSSFQSLLSPSLQQNPTTPTTDSYTHTLPDPTATTPKAPEPITTAELMAVCHSFIHQLRNGSAPWLLQRLNSTYGTMPSDPAEFSYWMALVMPIDENEKARLLPIRSPRLRLKLIVHWVESLRGSWWFSSGCVVG